MLPEGECSRHSLMKLFTPGIVLAVLLVVFGSPRIVAQVDVPAAKAVPADASPNDMARFLAGMQPLHSSFLASMASTGEWQRYASNMDAKWARFDALRMQKVRAWSAAELPSRSGSIFYPFSGPDFIYVSNFFPHASTYILCGLEPVGDVPGTEKIHSLGAALGGLESSFGTLFTAGYFVTKEMRTGLAANSLSGTLPVLYIMLARGDNAIRSVKQLHRGVEIRFSHAGEMRERTLYYFSVDLSDGALRGNREFLGFLKGAGIYATYVKAASYLLHTGVFSTIRSTILDETKIVLQDDSGIPLRYFDAGKWNMRFYGVYAPPLDIFKQHYQPDMAAMYSRIAQKPLDFGAGYQWNPKTANLLLATKK